MNQYIIVQGELSVAVSGFIKNDTGIEVPVDKIIKVISAPKGLYINPKNIQLIGSYALITQKERQNK